jgi:multiple sugar transport system permease protein
MENYRLRIAGKKTIIYVVSIFLCVMSLFPFWIMFINATRESFDIVSNFSLIPGRYFAQNFKTLYDRQSFDIMGGMWHSFQIASVATILSVYVSTMTAYGLLVYRYRLRTAAFTFIMAVLMIPTQVSAIGFFTFMYQLGLNNTYIPLMLPAAAAPATVFFMRQYMLSALPLEIVEAARIDGSGEFKTFNRVALPMMKPALATQAIFIFIANWNRLFEPSMIITSMDKYTLPMMVELLKSDRFRTDYGTVYMGLALTVLPLFMVYFMLSKYIIRGVAMGGLKE